MASVVVSDGSSKHYYFYYTYSIYWCFRLVAALPPPRAQLLITLFLPTLLKSLVPVAVAEYEFLREVRCGLLFWTEGAGLEEVARI